MNDQSNENMSGKTNWTQPSNIDNIKDFTKGVGITAKESLNKLKESVNKGLGPTKAVGSQALARIKKMFSFDLGPFNGLIMGLIIIAIFKVYIKQVLEVVTFLSIKSIKENTTGSKELAISGKIITISFLESCINYWFLMMTAVLIIFTIISFM